MARPLSSEHSAAGIAPPGYQLPDGTRPGPVKLQVADLSRSLPFYEDILGLRTIRQAGSSVLLGMPGRDAPLVDLVERPGAAPLPRRGLLGLFHVAFLLPDRGDLARFVGHLAAKNVRAGMSDHLVSEAVYLSDPDGLGIEVYADRPRSAWRSDRGQIAMATEPLDLSDLMQAAGDRSWEGMPAGTTVGHVHLHVGDLKRASAFYHDALGLSKVVWSYPGALFLSAGGYHHHLGINTWAGDAPPASDEHAKLLEWTLIVPQPDDDAAVSSLEAAGFAVVREPRGSLVADPWGTRLRIARAEK